MRRRISVVDDHGARRTALCRILDGESGWVIVESGDVDSLDEVLTRALVDVVVLSTSGGAEEIAGAVNEASRVRPGVRSVVISPRHEIAAVRSALQAGAAGYVLREDALGAIVQAVALAHEPTPYLSPSLGAHLAGDTPASLALDRREEEILRLVALGHTNADIAARLALSVRTIEFQRARLQRKLNAYTRPELVRLALDYGLIPA